jgi:hypothetical protein
MIQSRIRFALAAWFAVSVAIFTFRLIPAVAKYRLQGRELVNLEFERKHPPAPVIDLPPDSPWPTSTISMRGYAVKGLDETCLPGFSAVFHEQLLALVHGKVSLVEAKHKAQPELKNTFPKSLDEQIFQSAISGDGKVIATVGDFTVIRFWDAATGELLETIEDAAPTIAAQPDLNEHSRKHTNKLRYSDTGSRRLVAAPGGCLFAIGKIDGSVELWAAIEQKLPDRPHGLVTSQWPYEPDNNEPPPRKFHRIGRHQLHEGQVDYLEFTQDCQSLVSVSSWTATGIETLTAVPGMPARVKHAAGDLSHPAVMRTKVPSGEVEWRVPLAEIPRAFAMDAMSQNMPAGFPESPPRFAVAESDQVLLMSLQDGSVLKSFSVKINTARATQGTSTSSLAALSFGNLGGGQLWTVERRYLNSEPGKHQSMVSVSAWDINRGQRIASAEMPGHLLHATWSAYGMKLAIVRLNDHTSRSGKLQFPWESRSSSPFMLHVWDMRIVGRARSSVMEENPQ